MDSAPYPTRAPIGPPGGSKVTYTPSAPPPLYPAAGGAPMTPNTPVPISTAPVPTITNPNLSQTPGSPNVPPPPPPHDLTTSAETSINAPPPSSGPADGRASRKFPLMIVTMLLLTISGVLGGYFLFTKYASFGVAKQANAPVESVPLKEDTAEEQTSFSNPFAAPTVTYQNPFAQSPDDYVNPFGTYQNPFAVAESETTVDKLGDYKNPFE